MKILLTVTGLPDKRSPARSVFNLTYANELSKRGHEVTILYLRALNPRRALISTKELYGLQCLDVCSLIPKFGPIKNSIFASPLFRLLINHRKLRKAIEKADIIHAINGGAVAASYLISAKYKKPMISQFIGSDVNKHLTRLSASNNFMQGVERSQYLCFNSRGLEEVFCSSIFCGNKTKVLYRGVILDDFRYSYEKTSQTVNILFLGGFPNNGNLKGGHTLLEAIKLLDKMLLPKFIKLTIGGPNALNYSSLLTEISNDKMRLDFIGAVDKIRVKEKLNESHIVLIPSLSEGLPNVLYEAMASGNMIIATAVGGIPEVLKDGVTGALISADNPKDLAYCILKSISESKCIEDCAVNGRKEIEGMDYNKFIEGYLEIYEDSIYNFTN